MNLSSVAAVAKPRHPASASRQFTFAPARFCGAIREFFWGNLSPLLTALLAAFLLLGGLPSAAATPPQSTAAKAARGLIQRLLPADANHFVVQIIPPDQGRDVFELESRGDKIILRGNSGVSVASALKRYLNQYCHCDISWNCGNQLNLPRPLPPIPHPTRVVSPYPYRYAYNFCTHAYTFAWWDWPQWQHELDFLALNGINLALVIEGQEAVWIRTFQNFNFSNNAIRQWVVDPAHLPWMEMDNMESYPDEPPGLTPTLVARRLVLGQRIIERMRQLGIQPVLPGYYGMVPPAFRQKFPGANVHLQGNWARLKRPDILDPTDPLFPKVAAAYYAAETNLFGPIQFYDADPFHEGGSTKNINIAAAGQAIQHAMHGATWVLQSWQANPRQQMVDALNKNNVLILDLYCEDHENWRLRHNFNGAPWLWCAINCFGGNMKTGGRLAWMAQGPDNAFTNSDKGRMEGIGALMEATGVNPVLWEMLLQRGWNTRTPNLNNWLDNYSWRRYGARIPAAEKAWHILARTVYNEPPPSTAHTVKPAVCSRPTLHQPKLPPVMEQPIANRPVTKPYSDPAKLVAAWKLLLQAAPQAKSSDGYRFDLCDVGRQVLADLSTRYNREIVAAYKARDATRLRQLSGKMLGLIRDMDKLAGTRREWLLGVWLADARSWGNTKAEKDWCERNARELLTVWTRYDNITDYANRQWNGLLGDFYYHRWDMWLKALNDSLAQHTPLDLSATRNRIRDWELAWTRRTSNPYATRPHGDSIKLSKQLFKKYAAEASHP